MKADVNCPTLPTINNQCGLPLTPPPLPLPSVLQSRGSVVSTVTRLWARQLGFRTPVTARYLPSKMSRPAVGPTQPPIQWVLQARPLEVNWPGLEADHSPPPSARFKVSGALPPLPLHHLWHV